MSPRFQADADLHFDIVAGVLRREPSIDFQSAQEAVEEGWDDRSVLEFAAADERILVSHDVSTMPAHFASTMAHRSSPGVILAAAHADRGGD